MLNQDHHHQPLRHQLFPNCSRLPGIIMLLCALLSCSKPDQPPMNVLKDSNPVNLIVGTYTNGASQGLYQLEYDPVKRSFGATRLLAELDNPSYGASSDDHNMHYFVVEDRAGKLQVFNGSAADATLAAVNSHSTRGMHPCYVALSPDQRYLAVANYSSGNVAMFMLDDAGHPQAGPALLQHRGTGVNPQRQEGPHAHWAEWNPAATLLYVVDLGLDQVMAYPFDSGSGTLGDGFTALQTTPGAGPRHMVFHPSQERAYLLNELSNEVISAQIMANGQLLPQQTVSSLPDGFDGPSQGAHIAINGKGTRLYVSNRGHDSIAVFAVADEGTLQLLQHIGTGGHWPRFFLLLDDSNLLLAANERSDNLVAFAIDAQGVLTQVGDPASIPRPTYLGVWSEGP